MNPIGIGILAFIAYFGFRGFQRGLVDEVGRLVGLVLAILLANKFSPGLSEYIGLANEVARLAVAFLIVFVATLILMGLLTRAIRALVELVLLAWLDQIGGVVFGVLKSIVVLGVLIYILESFAVTHEFVARLETQSAVYRNVVVVKDGLFKLLTLDSMIQSAHDRMRAVEPQDLLNPFSDNP